MSDFPIEILAYKDRKPTFALLRTDLPRSTLVEVENEWGPVRREGRKRMNQAGRVEEAPRHWHWDWSRKSKKLEHLAYKCFGIECDQKMQGLLLVMVAGKEAKLAPDIGKPLVYVDYLESAPWNVIPIVEEPLYSGIGVVLMRTAVALSREVGFHGRVGLHALPQAEGFYCKCGMRGCGPDPDYDDLPYYEMTREIAEQFISNSSGIGT